MLKKIILPTLLILIGIILFTNGKRLTAEQNISETKHRLVIEYPDQYFADTADGEFALGYLGGIALFRDSEKEDIFVDFDYRFEKEGDDTPYQAGDSGAGLWPPQPDELVVPLTDEYQKVGEWLGQSLYVKKEIEAFGTVYQEVAPGTLTSYMPLLSEDQSRVNYYDRFIISRRSSDHRKSVV